MSLSRWSHWSQVIVQRMTLALLLSLAAAGTLWSIAATVGLVSWLELQVGLGAATTADAGIAIQLTVTAVFVGLCFFVPSSDRVRRLEISHRHFRVTMSDVAQAYQAAHAADREGVFELKSEFDSVRERIEYLRRHPDLGRLEPELLEMAAQMSHESRDLAEIYSTERVERARHFLRQRQEEAEQMRDRVQAAFTTCSELRLWLERVDIDEDFARSEVARLRHELLDLLPYFDLRAVDGSGANVERLDHHSFAAE